MGTGTIFSRHSAFLAAALLFVIFLVTGYCGYDAQWRVACSLFPGFVLTAFALCVPASAWLGTTLLRGVSPALIPLAAAFVRTES